MFKAAWAEISNVFITVFWVSIFLYVLISVVTFFCGVWDGNALRRDGDWRIFSHQCLSPPNYIRSYVPAYRYGCKMSRVIDLKWIPRIGPS